MSDIYKNSQQVYVAKPKAKRRRRSSRSGTFDETGERRRRSSNTGMRRLVHLFRKPSNEKKVWYTTLVIVLVTLFVVAIWQFVYRNHVAREQSRQNELHVPIQSQQHEASTSK